MLLQVSTFKILLISRHSRIQLASAHTGGADAGPKDVLLSGHVVRCGDAVDGIKVV